MKQEKHVKTLDPESPAPLYEQLRFILQDQITNGEFTYGSYLPTESELCEKYQVSRITAVRALNELEEAGLVQRVQGRGTKVKFQSQPHALSAVQGFTQYNKSIGNSTRSRVLSITSVNSDEMLLSTFGLPLDQKEEFVKFRRLRFINEVPAVVMTTFVRKWVGERMQDYDLSRASFYSLYQEITSLPVIRNETTLSPILATPDICHLLNVKPGTPHFLFTGVGFLEGEMTIEYSIAVYHGALFQFSTNIYRIRKPNTQELIEELAKEV